MFVKISDYGKTDDGNYIRYSVSDLSDKQSDYLNDNLDEDTVLNDDNLIITMYFDDEMYPFQSDVAKIRMDDFVAREEIEMTVFLSSFLEDMR